MTSCLREREREKERMRKREKERERERKRQTTNVDFICVFSNYKEKHKQKKTMLNKEQTN